MAAGASEMASGTKVSPSNCSSQWWVFVVQVGMGMGTVGGVGNVETER